MLAVEQVKEARKGVLSKGRRHSEDPADTADKKQEGGPPQLEVVDGNSQGTDDAKIKDEHEARKVRFSPTKRVRQEQFVDKGRASSEIVYLDAAAMADRKPKLVFDPITPYWELELLKGPSHLRKHEYEFRHYKMRQRRVLDFLNRKSSVYVTSGGDDMSLRSFATMYHGPKPPTITPALSLFDRVEKVFILPKETVEDAILPCNSTVRRFFVLVNSHGHNMCRVEEIEGPRRSSKPNLAIVDFFVGLTQGMIKRKGCSKKYREGMEVYCPVETFLGSVERSWKYSPTFHVKDKGGDLIFTLQLINSPCFPKFAAAKKLNFSVKSPDGTQHGSIRSDWDDLTYILYLSHFLYGISLPIGMESEQKLLLTAATLMVYYAYIEGKIVKQAVHIQKPSAQKFIEYQILCGTEPNVCVQGASTITSGSETESLRPLVEFD